MELVRGAETETEKRAGTRDKQEGTMHSAAKRRTCMSSWLMSICLAMLVVTRDLKVTKAVLLSL